MKKLVLTIGFCLVAVAFSFGQKKAVTEALRSAKSTQPNFTEARAKIKGALQHNETKNDASAWYAAGQIENLQFDKENTKQLIGQKADEAVMYSALYEIYPYFLKTYELDNLPDAKGKVKPKYTKDIKAILRVNLGHYINGGIYYYEQNDFKKAYDFFDQYVVISDGPLLKDGENTTAAVDSGYIISNYYAAMMALRLENDNQTAIKALTRASKIDYNRNDIFQSLVDIYDRTDDKVNLEKTLNEAIALLPKEQWFILKLTQFLIDEGKNDKAIEYINTALQNDPGNAQLLDVAGRIYETTFDDSEKAEEFFKKSLAIDGENADVLSDLGRIYYNRGVRQLEAANAINDMKLYNEEKEKALVLFRQALPYYEKSFQINREPYDTKLALRGIYYNLQMSDKAEEMSKLIDE